MYIPPKIWVWDQESGGKFASINRPVAGATHDKDLPVSEVAEASVDSTSAMLGFWQAQRRGQPRGFEHQVLFVSRRLR